MSRMFRQKSRHPRGSVLVLGLVVVTSLAALALIYGSRLQSGKRKMEIDLAYATTMDLAQSANDYNMKRVWREWQKQSATDPMTWAVANFRDKTKTDPSSPDYDASYNLNTASLKPFDKTSYTDNDSWETFGQGEIKLSAIILDRQNLPAGATDYVVIEFKSKARTLKDMTQDYYVEREVRRLVKFDSSATPSGTSNTTIPIQSQTFDFAYFVNNFGWMWGSPIYIHGNVGSNANLSFRFGPTVNGDLYAALNPDLGVDGQVLDGYPLTDTISQYRAKASGNSLYGPTNPVYTEDANQNGVLDTGEDGNGNGILDYEDFDLGFPGKQTRNTGQDPLPVPYLGDLSTYKTMAQDYSHDDVAPEVRSDLAVVLEAGGTGGFIKQLRKGGDPNNPAHYVTLVDTVYGDDPTENGLISTVDGDGDVATASMSDTQKLDTDPLKQWKNGNMALVGTAEQPIIIMGPVVITNDLVLKGVIKGQGTIFTGRNMHVVGDVEYAQPPQWSQNDKNFMNEHDDKEEHPDYDPSVPEADWTTIRSERQKDMLGFASKGSIIIGRYQSADDGWGWLKNYFFRTGFQDGTTQSYQTDPTDEAIGYYDPVTESFHGNYQAEDGGKRYNLNAETGGAATAVARKYYESSFSDEYISTLATDRPGKMHGVYYTNHLIGGRPGHETTGFQVVGAFVARDEGILFSTRLDMFYDPRVSNKNPSSHFSIFLPGNPSTTQVSPVPSPNLDATMSTLLWEEL